MKASEIKVLLENLSSKIKELEDYPEVEHFIGEHFQQRLGWDNECMDNSIELANYYNTLKEISKDEDFIYKLKFVLRNFSHSKRVVSEKEFKEQIAEEINSGYRGEDLEPIKCFKCNKSNYKDVTKSTIANSVCEFERVCSCGNVMGYWSYGNWMM